LNPRLLPHPRLFGGALALLVAGIVLLALASTVVLEAIGWALVGVAGVALVSLAFLLVGESEDRDRARNPRG
jgi:NADH:ubiquinone oxidoreductase subunit 5 (subunit L)/multisubunit Na+/H+ antiporter MnhA subunit